MIVWGESKKCVIEYSLFETEDSDYSILLPNFPTFCETIDAALAAGKQIIVHDIREGGRLSQCMLCAYGTYLVFPYCAVTARLGISVDGGACSHESATPASA